MLRAQITEPCQLRVTVIEAEDQGAPHDRTVVIDNTSVSPGPYECRIEARHRAHAHMLHVSMNDDDDFYLFNMRDRANPDIA